MHIGVAKKSFLKVSEELKFFLRSNEDAVRWYHGTCAYQHEAQLRLPLKLHLTSPYGRSIDYDGHSYRLSNELSLILQPDYSSSLPDKKLTCTLNMEGGGFGNDRSLLWYLPPPSPSYLVLISGRPQSKRIKLLGDLHSSLQYSRYRWFVDR